MWDQENFGDMMDNSFWVLYFMSPEFSVQKFPTQIIKFCVALITKIIRQGEQEGFLKIDRMNKICRMDRITLYNFRQAEHDFQAEHDDYLTILFILSKVSPQLSPCTLSFKSCNPVHF